MSAAVRDFVEALKGDLDEHINANIKNLCTCSADRHDHYAATVNALTQTRKLLDRRLKTFLSKDEEL